MTTLAVYDCMLFFRAAARPRHMDPQSTAGIDFRTRFPAVEVVTPAAFAALIAKTAP